MKWSKPLKRQNLARPASVFAGRRTSLRRAISSRRAGRTVASRCTWSSIFGYGAASTAAGPGETPDAPPFTRRLPRRGPGTPPQLRGSDPAPRGAADGRSSGPSYPTPPRPACPPLLARRAAAGSPHEVLVHEPVEVAVEHALGVADLVAGAQVLHHLVRVQHVAADLAAEIDVAHFAALPGELVGEAVLLAIHQLGLEHAHGHGLVLQLRALVLALHHDVGGEMRDAHGGAGLVHVLPAGAARAVGVDAQVVVVDLDVGVVAHQRRGVDGDEARVPAVGGVERAHTDQAMHAPLRLQQPVDVLALDGERGALEAGFVAFLRVVHLDLEGAALEPAQVHAQQHLGPVLRLGAAGAGMDGHDRAALVVLAAEEAQLLPALEIGLELGDAVHEFLEELVVDGVAAHLLAQQLFRGFEVAEPALELGEVLEAALDAAVPVS